jgi:hypothetical protein
MDRREQLGLLPLADEVAIRLLAQIPEEKRTECWWLIMCDGTPVAGNKGGGVLLLLELQSTRPLGRILRAARFSPIIDVMDTWLSEARKRLSPLVPEGPAPRRYP